MHYTLIRWPSGYCTRQQPSMWGFGSRALWIMCYKFMTGVWIAVQFRNEFHWNTDRNNILTTSLLLTDGRLKWLKVTSVRKAIMRRINVRMLHTLFEHMTMQRWPVVRSALPLEQSPFLFILFMGPTAVVLSDLCYFFNIIHNKSVTLRCSLLVASGWKQRGIGREIIEQLLKSFMDLEAPEHVNLKLKYIY